LVAGTAAVCSFERREAHRNLALACLWVLYI
jgi:hypothetical protein